MIEQLLTQYSGEIFSTIFVLFSSIIFRELRKRGFEDIALIGEASAPFILDALNRGKETFPASDEYLKNEAVKAISKNIPITTKVFTAGKSKKIAKMALENAYGKRLTESKLKKIESVGIGATLDGKNLGAEINAAFRRGDISARVGRSNGVTKAFIGGKWKI